MRSQAQMTVSTKKISICQYIRLKSRSNLPLAAVSSGEKSAGGNRSYEARLPFPARFLCIFLFFSQIA